MLTVPEDPAQPPVASVMEAVRRFDAFEGSFSPAAARSRALAFGPEQFAAGIRRAAEPLLPKASVVEGAL